MIRITFSYQIGLRFGGQEVERAESMAAAFMAIAVATDRGIRSDNPHLNGLLAAHPEGGYLIPGSCIRLIEFEMPGSK